jgi:hypothetical protein
MGEEGAMLSAYQSNLVTYFNDYVDSFTTALLSGPSQFVYHREIATEIRTFLEHQLRRDLSLYETHSKGYARHVDMLIELHARFTEELQEALLTTLSRHYRQ